MKCLIWIEFRCGCGEYNSAKSTSFFIRKNRYEKLQFWLWKRIECLNATLQLNWSPSKENKEWSSNSYSKSYSATRAANAKNCAFLRRVYWEEKVTWSSKCADSWSPSKGSLTLLRLADRRAASCWRLSLLTSSPSSVESGDRRLCFNK